MLQYTVSLARASFTQIYPLSLSLSLAAAAAAKSIKIALRAQQKHTQRFQLLLSDTIQARFLLPQIRYSQRRRRRIFSVEKSENGVVGVGTIIQQ
jgi:hypothetical protein